MGIETGQFIRLQVPARERALWIGPAWAVLCGIVASGAFTWTGRDLLIAALAVLLADGVWATIWWGVIDTDWPALISRWGKTAPGRSARSVPYAQPGSPADQAQHWLARFGAWRRSDLWPQAGTRVLSVIVAIGLTVVLSAIIGWPAFALSIAVLAVIQIGLLVRWTQTREPHLIHGLIDVGLAGTLGQIAFTNLDWLPLAIALLFSMTYAAVLDVAHAGTSILRWLLSELLVVILLTLVQQPTAAFALTAMLVAQALMASVLRGRSFARAAQFWLMAAMLIAAIAIR